MRVWKTGESLTISCAGLAVDGQVMLASPNGKSLAIVFEAVLDDCVAMMPVLWVDEDQAFKNLATGRLVRLAPRESN